MKLSIYNVSKILVANKNKNSRWYSSQKDASAAYLDKFREKVELYGNRYYPEEAKQQQLKGEVRLMVILNAQGEFVQFVCLKAQVIQF